MCDCPAGAGLCEGEKDTPAWARYKPLQVSTGQWSGRVVTTSGHAGGVAHTSYVRSWHSIRESFVEQLSFVRQHFKPLNGCDTGTS